MTDELFVLLLIPIASLSAGLTLHYAVKPFFEALIKVMREPRRFNDPATETELAELRSDVQILAETVEVLSSTVDFDRQLAASRRESPPTEL